ncbi:GlcNAc-transferase family protein [Hoeflea prorocentri]|uniref:Glycosyltransferase (GlcNAc) n=1 Tax=Hoeflea prorocentri TaxID=1922333 RepID=A0A9X3UMG9_9HYPH|nr:GlcNAc-transferase family protein [Hoeflea prorocentri]MCY6383438.1 hypothetical protein [Hoeflea prorocentri]MDA5401238.1 hypothetical protein [Hoeflea prorocentri]
MATIFIQIASYRDTELLPTLRDCVSKARHPENLRFGICWQRDETETLGEFADDSRFRVREHHYSVSKGLGWARQQTQSLYDGEDYSMQVDAHQRFVEDWDVILIDMLNSIDSEKPLLTCYAPPYDPLNEDQPLSHTPSSLGFDQFTPEGALLIRPTHMKDWQARQSPVPGRYFSGHFSFTIGQWCRDVLYDPEYYFHGEEISMAVRSYTHGYDIFYPHRVVVWHEYTRKYRTTHWNDHVPEKGATVSWYKRNEDSQRRMRILFKQEEADIDFRHLGFGPARSLEHYERYAGVNFRLKAVQRYTFENHEPPNPEIYGSDEEWVSNNVDDFWCRVLLPEGTYDPKTDYETLYVSINNALGESIYRKDMHGDEVRAIFDQRRPAFIQPYKSFEEAAGWTVRLKDSAGEELAEITRPIVR